MKVEADQKPALLRYLEQVFEIAGPDVVTSLTPRQLQPYLVEGLSQVSPNYAAAELKERQHDVKPTNFDEKLSEVQGTLHSYMNNIETPMNRFAAQVHAETAPGADVSDNFGFSALAVELALHAARLRVYRETLKLLGVVVEATGSAELALATVRAEMVDRLLDSRGIEGPSDGAGIGTSQALKAVIKVLNRAC